MVQNSLIIQYSSFLIDAGSFVTDIENLIRFQPSLIIGLLGLTAEMYLELNFGIKVLPSSKICVRILDYPYMISYKEIRSELVDQLVSIRGTVVRISSVKPLPTSICYQCPECSSEFNLDSNSAPENCIRSGCKAKPSSFKPLLDSSKTITINWQKVRIQENSLFDNAFDAGRIPRSVECELSQDLVDSVIPGDIIIATGIIKHVKISESKLKKNVSMMTLYLDINSVEKVFQLDEKNLSFDKELDSFRRFSSKKNAFETLVHSICPSIYGHELVKMGLLLCLMSGRQRASNSNSKVPIRNNSHILIVGDPGMGKSQMLSYVSKLAPRGVYVSSNTTTASGLTVTLTKESGSGEFLLEAGALVLADQGCCCIDEFDKMTQHEALLEAMEQQSISIAKGGLVCSLPARACVMAAANPVGGHYNSRKTVSENLKLDAALLSRFDLIFILLDRPDAERDKRLSNHLMKITYQGRQNQDAQLSNDSTTDLIKKLTKTEDLETQDAEFMRNYVTLARKVSQPRLSNQAAELLQNFYLELRKNKKFSMADSIPITTRQLESMIRLSEARARCELRDLVLQSDAEDVIQLMRRSLLDSYANEEGDVIPDRSQFGTGMSKRKEVKRFIERLRREHSQSCNDLFTYKQLLDLATEMKIKYDNFKDFVEILNNQNYLLKKPNNVYKLTN